MNICTTLALREIPGDFVVWLLIDPHVILLPSLSNSDQAQSSTLAKRPSTDQHLLNSFCLNGDCKPKIAAANTAAVA